MPVRCRTASRIALDGMVPVWMHTPPTLCSRSIDRDALAELGGVERRLLPGGAGADHDEVIGILILLQVHASDVSVVTVMRLINRDIARPR